MWSMNATASAQMPLSHTPTAHIVPHDPAVVELSDIHNFMLRRHQEFAPFGSDDDVFLDADRAENWFQRERHAFLNNATGTMTVPEIVRTEQQAAIVGTRANLVSSRVEELVAAARDMAPGDR